MVETMCQFNIVKPRNECDKTGHELLVSCMKYDHYRVEHYIDNFSKNRFVLFINKEPASAILFDSGKVCEFRETLDKHRGMRLNHQLWGYCAGVLGNIKHSENLTLSGQKALGLIR